VFNICSNVHVLTYDAVTLLGSIRLWPSKNCRSIWNDHFTRYALFPFDAVGYTDRSDVCQRAESWPEDAEKSIISHLSACSSLKSACASEWSRCVCAGALHRQSSKRSDLGLPLKARVQSRDYVSHNQSGQGLRWRNPEQNHSGCEIRSLESRHKKASLGKLLEKGDNGQWSDEIWSQRPRRIGEEESQRSAG